MGRKRKQVEAPASVPRTRRKVDITARNHMQKEYIKAIKANDITFGIGPAGTGKTYLAAKMAMYFLSEGIVSKIVICRPAVEANGERIGFLPGGIAEKMDPYLKPIFDVFRTFWGAKTIKDYQDNDVIEIVPLAYMRGRTFSDAFIIADEMQNGTLDQFLMLMTRFGDDAKMVITGDPDQTDIGDTSGINKVEKIVANVDTVDFIHFDTRDIVRHPTVEKILRAWNGDVVGINTNDDVEEDMPAFLRTKIV